MEAEALMFAAQLSLKKGVKLYGRKAIEGFSFPIVCWNEVVNPLSL